MCQRSAGIEGAARELLRWRMIRSACLSLPDVCCRVMSRYRGFQNDRPATLRAALENGYDAETLRRLARALDIDRPTRKAELAAAVAAAVLVRHPDSRKTEDLFQRLTDLERTAVAEALYDKQHTFDRARFAAKYGSVPTQPDRWSHRSHEKMTLAAAFLVPGGRDGGARFIPDDLATRLAAFVPEPPPATIATTDEPVALNRRLELTVVETERSAPQELFSVLRLADTRRISASAKTRRPSAKGMEAVREVLAGGDFYPIEEKRNSWDQVIGPMRAFAWPMILQAAGLASVSGTKLALTAAGRRALGRSAVETLRDAWEKWVGTSIFDEFSRIDSIKGQSDRKRLTAVAERRGAIADALAECPPCRWVAIDELSQHMIATGNTFEIAHDPWRLYIEEMQYGSLGYEGSHDWSILQERYMAAVLFEYAATLGLVDVAFTSPEGARKDFGSLWGADGLRFLSRYDGLSSIRLNALGAFVLGLTESYEPHAIVPDGPGVRVLGSLAVVPAGEGFSAAGEAVLSTFCARRGDGFVLDRATALAAIEKGHDARDLSRFLEAASAGELPDAARALLADVEKRAAMLQVSGHALLIECADPDVASMLASDRTTRHLCLPIDTATIAVPIEWEADFRRAVRALGYPLREQSK